ncbi:MAG: hypothetical protein AMXMBFR47_14260 [Planctomycetota bacterium]
MSPSRTLRIFAAAAALLSAGLAALSGGCPADSATNPTLPPTVVAGDSAVNDGGGDASVGSGGISGGSGSGTSMSGGSSSGGGGAGAINAPQIVVAGWMNEPLRAVLVAAADRTADLTFELAGEPSPGGTADLFANPGADVTLVYTPVDDFVGDAFVTVNIRDGAASGTAIVRFRVLPKVEFAMDRYEGEAPAGMLASATIPSGHTLPDDVELHWAFGDGSEATDAGTNMNRTHVFSSPGVYLVSLALLVGGVGGELGCTHANPGPANFTARERSGGTGTNQPPSAAAGADQNVIDEDGNGFALVTLSGGASSDPDGQIVAYTWAVEGGATYGPNPTPSTAISLAVGTWNITLTVMDDGGATASDTLRVVVGSSAILAISPDAPLSASGVMGGPFTPASQEYTITNSGDAPLTWSASHGQNWIDLSSAGGTLAAGASTTITVSITSAANSFLVGNYGGQISFTNTASGAVLTRAVELSVVPAGGLLVSSGSLTSAGLVGGPFSPSSRNYTLTNTGSTAITWSATKTRPWVTLSAAGGTLAGGAAATVTVSLNSQANSLSAGVHSDTVSFANTTNGMGNTTRSVSLTVTAPAMLNVSGTDLAASGPPGGPFSPASTTYTLSNSGGVSLNWTAGANQAWLTVSPTSGTLAAGGSTTVTASINSNANALAAGSYGASVSLTNATNGAGNATRNATLNVSTVQMASSISQYGITWTFDRPYRVGQFVNGDWWVCPDTPSGTVTVMSVTPVPVYGTTDTDQLARNGSCVNPTATTTNQPYDGRYYSSSGNNYSSAQAVRFPVALAANSSLVSTVSRPDGDADRPNLLGTSTSLAKVKLQDAAVLTCLATAPPVDAFRPPYAGTTKPLLRFSDLDLARLPNLSPPNYANIHTWGVFYAGVYQTSSSPGLAYARFFQRPWLMHVMGDTGENVRPLNNCPGYYRDAHAIESDAALLLCIDGTASSYFGQAGGSKVDLLIAFVQFGIDTYYCIQTNPNPTSRGDRCLSKWPCVFLGLLSGQPQYYTSLNYSNPLFGYQYFKTDACTYSGAGWTNTTYKPLGAIWLFRVDPTSETDNPSDYHYEHLDPFTVGWCGTYPGSNPFWREESYRRATHSWTWIGTALAARLLGGVDAWDHLPFFGYCDRWMQESEASYFSALQAIGNQAPNGPCNDGTYGLSYQHGQLPGLQFVRDMWNAYR